MNNIENEFEKRKTIYQRTAENKENPIDVMIDEDITETIKICETVKNDSLVKLIELTTDLREESENYKTRIKMYNDIKTDFNKVFNEFATTGQKLKSLYYKNKGILGINDDFVDNINDILEENITYKNIRKKISEIDIMKNKVQEKYTKIKKTIKLVDSKFSELFETNQDIAKKFVDNGMNDKVTCKICYTNKVNTCINPCGHLFCDMCLNNLTDNSCPLCRNNMISKIKIYGIGEHESNEPLPNGSLSTDVNINHLLHMIARQPDNNWNQNNNNDY